MKKILLAFAAALLLVGCAKEYDDSTLKARIDGLEKRVSDLEGSITAIQTAVGDGVLVAKVQELADPETGKIVGVTITYTNGDIKYFEITPKADYDGPVLSVIKSGSGDLVWAIDGVAIEVNGKEVPVYQTPEFTIDEDGNLLVSIDGGEPVVLGQVQNEGATLVDGIFTDIKITDEAVVLTLSDGSTVNIPFAEAFKLTLEVEEFAYTAGAPITVHYDVTAATAGTVVKVAGYNPLEFGVKIDADAKTIEITPIKKGAAAQMLVVADSGIGMVSTATLLIEPEGVTVVNSEADSLFGMADYVADGAGDVIEAIVVSNVNFQVLPQEEWIHLESVKGQTYTITLSLDPNEDTESGRIGTVLIVKEGIPADAVTESDIYQTITIAQMQAPIPEEPDGMADLSEKESANSYIVTAPGAYKFKAVKGNSDESVGDINSVVVLWETVNTDTAPLEGAIIADSGFNGDYISFTATGTSGNALIAAEDADGTVLWSWHIWVPATEIENITDEAFYSLPVMDRNLGALDKATAAAAGRETYGMYYQWGRSTPLPGFAVATAAVTVEDGPKSTAFAIANPTAFIKVSESDTAGNWNEEDLAYLWETESGEKAIYDPCPPGYKVPSYNSETGLWVNGNDGWVYNWDANNFAYGEVVFPMAGWYSSSASVGYEGARSIIHSATAHSNPRARLKIIRKDKDGYYYANYFKQEAASVRCVVVDENAITPPTPPEPVAEAIDLSEEGSANSYIVYAEGEYKFAAVKGNSEESVGAVESVEVLWETVNTDTAPEVASIINACGVSEGYILFDATGTPGNALIAAKDADGNILWSWHIWVPATPVADLDATDLAGLAKMQDRNLGALVVTPATGDSDPLSIGLYYQWGRKDPFPGSASISSNKASAVAGEGMTKHDALVSVEYAIAHPTEYVYVPNVDNSDWTETHPADLWDNAGKKTIYDPCPAGYRVPVRDSSKPMWDTSGTGWDTSADYRYIFGDHVFPTAGYIDCYGGDYYKVGARSFVWSATSREDTRAYCLFNKDKNFENSSFHKAKAGSVRCVAE